MHTEYTLHNFMRASGTDVSLCYYKMHALGLAMRQMICQIIFLPVHFQAGRPYLILCAGQSLEYGEGGGGVLAYL